MKKSTIIFFLILTFGFSWGIWLVLWLTGLWQNQIAYYGLTALAMWMPAVAAIISHKNMGDDWSYRFLPDIKVEWKFYLQMWFIIPVFVILGAGVYYFLFSEDVDFTLSSLRGLAGQGVNLPPLSSMVLVTLFSLFTMAPLINSFLAFGEELGWRGYLYPLLKERFGQRRADLYTGLIWGIWHLPILLMGHNYGRATWGYPLTNLLTMMIFCTVVQIIFRYWLEKAGSIWIVALAHGSINAAATFGNLFLSTQADPDHLLFGPSVAGIAGMFPLMMLALAVLWKERKGTI